ncbi:MAG: putative porin [bacterium]
MLIRQIILYSVIGFFYLQTSASPCYGRSISFFISNGDTSVVIDSIKVTDSLTVADSLASVDSLAQTAIPDTLIPLQQKGILSSSDWGEIYTKNKLNMLDYQSFHNLFNSMPYGFVKDFGSFGQPHELTLYGLGYGSIDFIIDGVPINRRGNNAYDLNHIQTEQIDSLEIIPLSRGFLYNTFNNPVSVNIVTMDKVAKRAYSRLRILQAPDDEGYIDGLFNTHFSKRINFSFDVTNSSINSRYSNSQAGGWLASARLRYMLFNTVNIISSYNYSRTETWLNGGVDKYLLYSNYSAAVAEEIFYNNIEAPVIYGTDEHGSLRYLKSKEHNFSLKVLSQFVPELFSDITFYYRFSLDEFRQNESQSQSEPPYFKNNDKEKVLGISFKQNFTTDYLNALFLLNYESQNIKDDYQLINSTESLFSAGGYVQFPLANNLLTPGVFAKHLKYAGNSYSSYGAEVLVKPISSLDIFAGYSENNKPNFIKPRAVDGEHQAWKHDQKITTMESGIKFRWSEGFVSAGFIHYSNSSYLFPVVLKSYEDSLILNEVSYFNPSQLEYSTVNLSFALSLWKLQFEGKLCYYAANNTETEFTLPEYSSFGGVYYIDTLFNSNLKLKTGFNFYSTGEQRYYTYDFQLMRPAIVRYTEPEYSDAALNSEYNNELISPSYSLDFYLAGQIKDSAIIYFVFENLTGNNYYIIPYYPKPGRQIRFGVAWEFLD